MLKRYLLPIMAFVFVSGVALSGGADKRANVSITYISHADAATCKTEDNLKETAEKFAGMCCKGSIKSVFPSSMWKKTVGDIQKNKSKDSDYKTAWKLISRQEYRK